MLSLSDALDYAIYLQHIILKITGLKVGEILIRPYVDNQSVVNALYSTKEVDNKRLCIDIGATKQLIQRNEVTSVQWIPGKRC